MTPEQLLDRQTRITGFQKELEELYKKYELSLSAFYDTPSLKMSLPLQIVDAKRYQTATAEVPTPVKAPVKKQK